jgi:hypothetical protein
MRKFMLAAMLNAISFQVPSLAQQPNWQTTEVPSKRCKHFIQVHDNPALKWPQQSMLYGISCKVSLEAMNSNSVT